MVAVEVILHHLHRLELFEARFLGYLVLAAVGIVFEMAHIGDVTHIAHLIAEMCQIAEKHIESNGGTGVSQMPVAIYGRTAHIHSHPSGVDGTEEFFLSRKRIVDGEIVGFHF